MSIEKAIEIALDGWITVHYGEEKEDGKQGYRRLFVRGGETPKEAMKRAWGVDLDKKGKKGESKKEDSSKAEEKQKEALSKEDEEKIKNILEKGNYGKLSKEYVAEIKNSLDSNFRDYPAVTDVVSSVGSIQAINKEIAQKALKERAEEVNNAIKKTKEFYFNYYTEEEIVRRFGSKEKLENKIKQDVEKRITKMVTHKAEGEWAHYAWRESEKKGFLRFNEKFKNVSDMKIGLVYSLASKFHPDGCDTVKSVVDHEFGHAIERFIKQNSPQNQHYQELISLYNDRLFKGNIKEELSSYGKTNFSEFIAEGYSEFKNNKNPRELSTKIGTLLKKAYEASLEARKWKKQ